MYILPNRSNCDYHFIMKELTNKSKSHFECLRENIEMYNTFSVLVEKEMRKGDKDGHEAITTISYKINCIDSVRFMTISLSSFVDNFVEGIHKIKCKNFNCFLNRKVPMPV